MFALLALAFLTGGCAMTKPPLHGDAGYPADWPGIDTLSTECERLDGSYANEGMVIDRKGTARSVSLTDILLQQSPAGVDSISLLVAGEKGAPGKTVPTRLHIRFGAQDGDAGELSDCFWIKQALLCAGVRKSGGGFPYLGLTGPQQNVWLMRATDGSLLVKVWDYTAGIVVAVPFYHQSYVWARFKRTVPGD